MRLGPAHTTPLGHGPLGVGQKSLCVQKPHHKSRNDARSVFRAHASWRGKWKLSRNRGVDFKKAGLAKFTPSGTVCLGGGPRQGPLGVVRY